MQISSSLKQQLCRGRVIPFVGAGVSRAVCGHDGRPLFPSWEELLLAGVELLVSEGKIRHADFVRFLVEVDQDYLAAAKRLRDELASLWAVFLQEQLIVKKTDVRAASLALPRAIWALGSRLLITTNYDHVLDWACPPELLAEYNLAHWDIESVVEQAQLVQNLRPPAPTAWHLHGRIDNVARLVLTPGGYDRLYGSEEQEQQHRAALSTLRQLLAARSFLFVGFSLDDAHLSGEFQAVHELFQGSTAPHYALVRSKDAERVAKLGVEPVVFEDFAALPALVEELGREAAFGQEVTVGAPTPRLPDELSPPDWTDYLKALIDQTGYVNIRGISTSSSIEAPRHPIERLYTPLYARDLTHRLDKHGAAEGFEVSVGLAELLPHHDRLLIEGQPGAGKTTFLRFVAAMLARDAAGQPCPAGGSWRRCYLGLDDGDPPPTPVFVRLADLVPLLEDRDPLRHDDHRWLLDFLDRICAKNGYPISRDTWQQILEGGSAALFLDGLDEIADEKLRSRLFDVFRDACRRWRCPMVVTSRPISTGELRDMGFRLATIDRLGDREIALFLEHWVTALHAAGSVEKLGNEGETYRQSLHEAITERPRVRRLATNPVMLTCLCVVHWNEGRLPEGRSRVYGAVVRWLLAARKVQREKAGYGDRFAHRALARLALVMMSAEGGKRSVLDLEEAAVAIDAVAAREFPKLDAQERRHRSRTWLRFECLGSGLVEEVAGKRIRFWHLTFQEYLAALELAWRGDGDDPAADWWPVIAERLDHVQWRETVELLPGCLFDEGGEGRVDRLLARVLGLRRKAPELAEEARVAGIVGRLLQPLSVYGYRVRPEVATAYEVALERSMAIFTTEGAAEVPVEVRIAAAEALGRGGDPRFKSFEKNLKEVPACDGWHLGKYPTIVEEYQRFVEHRGYEERRYWGDEGWSVREEKGWEEPGAWEEQLVTPNRPVVLVSWYEAEAYCKWLSEQRSAEVRLPQEAWWEKAAKPESGGYPWGREDPDVERANFAPDLEPNVGSATPVGIYPAGDGRFGHCDLAGNVWEWCADRVAGPGAEGWKALRGGGWALSAESLRSGHRLGNPASDRSRVVGFRISCHIREP